MARNFNGSTDKITAASNTPVNFEYNQPFSVFGWWYFSSTNFAQQQSLIGDLGGSPYPGWEMRKNPTTNILLVYIINSVVSTTHYILRPGLTSNKPASNAWNHCGFTYNGSHLLAGTHLYLNKVLIDDNVGSVNTLGTNSILSSGPLIICSNQDPSPFSGRVAEVAVWNVVLTANEINALYAGQRANRIRSSALVAYWPLDGLSSPEPDLSGNANYGTLTGTTLANGPPVTMFTPRWPVNDVFPSIGPSFVPAWATQLNPPILGSGIY